MSVHSKRMMETDNTKKVEQVYRRSRKILFFKEVLLLTLVGIVAGLAIYTTNDARAAFGLTSTPVFANQLPVIKQFRISSLTSEPFLEFDIRPTVYPEVQVEARLFDPTDPPPVENFNVLNTRVGGEVALFWTYPENIEKVNIYRTFIKDVDDVDVEKLDRRKEKLIVEKLNGTNYIDTDIQDNEAYQYRIVSLYTEGDKEYESSVGRIETIIPTDEIPPLPPTNISIRSVDQEGKTGLEILWLNPEDNDFDHIRVFRSLSYGTRGEEIAFVRANQTAAYVDFDIAPNEKVFYTVVAYDESENASTDDFQIAAPGNENPFTPFRVDSNTGEFLTVETK